VPTSLVLVDFDSTATGETLRVEQVERVVSTDVDLKAGLA